MTTIANTTSAPVPFDVLYRRMLPQFRYYAKWLVRRKGRWIDFDDVIQELSGFALEDYTSLVRRGKETFYTPIAKYAIKRHREGRRFVGTNTTDILSEQTQKLGRSDTCQLSQFDDEPRNWGLGLYQRQPDIADAVQMHLDYEAWYQRQTPRDQAIIKDLSYGETTGDVAKKYGVSAGLISQYRKRYSDSWHAFIADKREPA